jgi:hypothetical protein
MLLSELYFFTGGDAFLIDRGGHLKNGTMLYFLLWGVSVTFLTAQNSTGDGGTKVPSLAQ